MVLRFLFIRKIPSRSLIEHGWPFYSVKALNLEALLQTMIVANTFHEEVKKTQISKYHNTLQLNNIYLHIAN